MNASRSGNDHCVRIANQNNQKWSLTGPTQLHPRELRDRDSVYTPIEWLSACAPVGAPSTCARLAEQLRHLVSERSQSLVATMSDVPAGGSAYLPPEVARAVAWSLPMARPPLRPNLRT